MQVDGNFGGAAGIAEMLLQSHNGEIQLLPAFPDPWPEGIVTGLRARGGFEAAMTWKNGLLAAAEISSKHGGTCVVRYDRIRELRVTSGRALAIGPGLS